MRTLAIFLLCLLGYVCHRWLVLDGSLPLMFDANEAEYGFFRALLPYLDMPIQKVVWNPQTRGEFLNACRTVGNQMHGSLAVAGYVLLKILQTEPRPQMGTWLLKTMAIFYSAIGLTGWLVGLWRALPREKSHWAMVSFGMLYTFAPPVFVKITVLHWGTHEMANAALGIMMAFALPWWLTPCTNRNLVVRGALLGIFIAALPMFNYSLLLVIGLVMGTWLLERLTFGTRAIRLRTLALFGLAIGIGYALLSKILASGFFYGLGFPKNLPTDSFLMLAGKQGRPFLSESTGGGVHLAALLKSEVWSDGMQWLPGPAWGKGWADLEQLTKGALLILAGILWPVRVIRGEQATDSLRLAGLLGLSWLIGWMAISLLCVGFSIDGGAPMGVTPRYYTLLYPIGFACLSCCALWLGRWAAFPWAIIIGLGVQDSLRYIDLSSSATHYDATALYFRDRPEPMPTTVQLPLVEKGEDWLFGYSLIQRFQYRQYWKYWTASEKYSLPIQAMVTQHRQSARNKVNNSEDFEAGMQAALQTLYPQTATEWLKAQLEVPP
ncbi:MAG: hypothetical protein ACON4U_00235 [Myxococcota bacterium]